MKLYATWNQIFLQKIYHIHLNNREVDVWFRSCTIFRCQMLDKPFNAVSNHFEMINHFLGDFINGFEDSGNFFPFEYYISIGICDMQSWYRNVDSNFMLEKGIGTFNTFDFSLIITSIEHFRLRRNGKWKTWLRKTKFFPHAHFVFYLWIVMDSVFGRLSCMLNSLIKSYVQWNRIFPLGWKS